MCQLADMNRALPLPAGRLAWLQVSSLQTSLERTSGDREQLAAAAREMKAMMERLHKRQAKQDKRHARQLQDAREEHDQQVGAGGCAHSRGVQQAGAILCVLCLYGDGGGGGGAQPLTCRPPWGPTRTTLCDTDSPAWMMRPSQPPHCPGTSHPRGCVLVQGRCCVGGVVTMRPQGFTTRPRPAVKR